VSFPFDLRSAAVSHSHLPCCAPTMPLFSRPRHSTSIKRQPVGYLPALRFLPATTRSSTKVVIRRIPISDAGGQCETKQRSVAAHYKKDDLLRFWSSSSDISSYRVDFLRRTRHYWSMAGAWNGMCELMHGMAGERHDSVFIVL